MEMVPEMKKVLMVDDELPFLEAVREGLSEYAEEYDVLTAENGLEAVRLLEQNRPDIVVTDLKMPRMDGFELVAYMTREHGDIPIIVLTGYGDSKISAHLKKMGAFRYLEKPVDFSVLADHIRDAALGGVGGYVSGIGLSSFLQIAEYDQKSRSLKVYSEGRTGYVYLKDGSFVEARYGDLHGDAAAVKMLGWDNPRIEILSEEKEARSNVRSSLAQLILRASEEQEQCETEDQTANPKLLEEGIALAEGLHFKKARKALHQYLKGSPRSLIGWLWYSRVALKKKSLETALKNARFLAPEDAEILEEIGKFKASVNYIEGETLRHCPLCWAPTRKYAPQCPHCLSLLVIDKSGFKAIGLGRQEVLRQARERLLKVRMAEPNAKANYYLAVVFFNLQEYGESSHYLREAIRLAPDKKFFSAQLEELMAFIASGSVENEETKRQRALEVLTSEKKAAGGWGKSVLVVEDSPTTRKVISLTLAKNGFQIQEAGDGLEALSRLSEKKPDLILLDIILPRMDGYEILALIRRNPELKHIPVVMLTSKDGLINKMKGRLAGSNAYLTKPFDPKELISTVEKYLA